MNVLRVHHPGLLTTVQDLGRPFVRRYGVPTGGAMDKFALRVANLLVGNDEGAAGLECALLGPDISFAQDTWVAVTGALVPGAPRVRPKKIPAGEVLSIRSFLAGCRVYVAVAGGIMVPPVLGSGSTYTRGRFGGFKGRTLRARDELPLGPAMANVKDAEHWYIDEDFGPHYSGHADARFVPGPQWGSFGEHAQARFLNTTYRVSPQSDRMGVRLHGAAIERSDKTELTSEPVAEGAIQVPPDGQSIVLAADCQTIGGYPQVGHVITVDLPVIAQLRPGDTVRFRECTLDDAHGLLLRREAAFAKLRAGLATKTK